jgi:hypothetical protein
VKTRFHEQDQCLGSEFGERVLTCPLVFPLTLHVLPDQYGSEDHLQPVDKITVQGLMEVISSKDLVQFVSKEYASHASKVFDSLNIPKLMMQNVWVVFEDMLPMMHL